MTTKINSHWFENLGEAHKKFIENVVLAWFNSSNCGIALCDHDTEIMEMVGLIALFRAHKSFKKLHGPWINSTKPSKLTFSSFFKLLRNNTTDNDFLIGECPSNTQDILEIAKKPNFSMDHVTLWCSMDACFAAARSKDNCIPEDPREEEYLRENYAEGIVMCASILKRGSVATPTTRRITRATKHYFSRVKRDRIDC